jgi:hypothetical protein
VGSTGSAAAGSAGSTGNPGSTAAGSAEGSAGDAASDETNGVPGKVLEAHAGFKLIVPPGFTVQRQGRNVFARAPGYTISIGPITSKQLDPEAAAKEYADVVGLTLDGIGDVDINGISRSGASLHGTLYGDEVSQSIINFIGPGYRVAVILTMPNAARNDPKVRAFADDLFSKRVVVPTPY